MKTLIIRYSGKNSLMQAAEIIKNGGIVAFPTETVYGLGGNALDPNAASKIYAAKGRPSDNPLIVHLHKYENAGVYAHTTPLFFEIADAFMPGPITVILKKRSFIPDSVTGGLDTVGLRVPSNKIARELIELSGVPIAAPSANISGKPSPTCFEHVYHDLNGKVDAIIDGGSCDFGVESTIVKLDGQNIQLLRPGAVTVEMLSLFGDGLYVDPAVTEKFDGTPLAPGMKYRHYAPSTPLTVLDGENKAVYTYLSERPEVGVICFDEDLSHLHNKFVISCGSSCDTLTQARMLFECLRRMDERKDLKHIYARIPSRVGIGLAVFNRLIKAAGFSVITLK